MEATSPAPPNLGESPQILARLNEIPSPVLVGAQRTEIDKAPGMFAESYRDHHAFALTDMIEPSFFARLLQLCNAAQFIVDTETDVAQRQRETPGIAGRGLALVLQRKNLMQWLESATGCEPLRSTFGRIMQISPGDSPRLNWHDDLPEDPSRRLGITINLSENAYEGGLFELREKKSGKILMRHRHEKLGSTLIFDVGDELEHRVWPITGGGPRRVFTGWFLKAPVA